jgi:hypothetical protein
MAYAIKFSGNSFYGPYGGAVVGQRRTKCRAKVWITRAPADAKVESLKKLIGGGYTDCEVIEVRACFAIEDELISERAKLVAQIEAIDALIAK